MSKSSKCPRNMQELAGILNLSRATVSYVLNNRWRQQNISEDTAERVIKYVEKTGYVPNNYSLALKGLLKKNVAILLGTKPVLEHQKRAFFKLLESIDSAGLDHVILSLSEANWRDVVQQMKTFKIEKIVVLATSINLSESLWIKIIDNLPSAKWFFYDFLFERMNPASFARDNIFIIGVNRALASKMVFEYIAEKGHKRLIFPDYVKYKKDYHVLSDVEFYNPPELHFSFPSSKFSPLVRGEMIGEQILQMPLENKPTAVFINDDLMSIGAIKRLLRAGYRIPEDLAFISWDGLPESDYFIMSLTTLVIPHEKMLQATYEWLFHDKAPASIYWEFEIRQGETMP